MSTIDAEPALRYAVLGLPVFPCQPGGKTPATGQGFKDATTDAGRIANWFEFGDRNVAIATGNGILVLDVDRHGVDGETTLAGLMREHGALPTTWEAATPSGGRHLYFRTTESVRNSAGKVGAGLDIRGDGGYVVAPPSMTPDGAYAWTNAPDATVLADCPAWLLALAKGKAKGDKRRDLLVLAMYESRPWNGEERQLHQLPKN
jgi:hypothetical protein